MYTVEQIRKAGAEAMLASTVEHIIEKLIELYGSEPHQLLQQTPCTAPVCPFCQCEAVGFGGACGDNSLRCMEC